MCVVFVGSGGGDLLDFGAFSAAPAASSDLGAHAAPKANDNGPELFNDFVSAPVESSPPPPAVQEVN